MKAQILEYLAKLMGEVIVVDKEEVIDVCVLDDATTAVDDFEEWLEEKCEDADLDLYRYYSFKDVTVCVWDSSLND